MEIWGIPNTSGSQIWSTLHQHQTHFGSLSGKQLRPTKSEYLSVGPEDLFYEKIPQGDHRSHLRISGRSGIMRILNVINSQLEPTESGYGMGSDDAGSPSTVSNGLGDFTHPFIQHY